MGVAKKKQLRTEKVLVGTRLMRQGEHCETKDPVQVSAQSCLYCLAQYHSLHKAYAGCSQGFRAFPSDAAQYSMYQCDFMSQTAAAKNYYINKNQIYNIACAVVIFIPCQFKLVCVDSLFGIVGVPLNAWETLIYRMDICLVDM